MTKQERIEELERLIDQKQKEVDRYNAQQMAFKLVLNSTYGSFGNKYFVCTNEEIANAITSMGREIIQYMDECANRYFHERWHLDTKLHQKLGIKTPKPIPENVPLAIYADTDSAFICFDPVLQSCDWQGDPFEFIMKLNDLKLSDFFSKCLEHYAKKYGVKNIQDFELERVSESVIWLQKKRYVQNVVYEDGQTFDRLSYIYPKGVELIKSSTPLFVRESLMNVMKYLLDTKQNINISELNKYVRKIKQEFELADIEDIANTSSLNDLDKWVVNDQARFEYASGTPQHVKGAIFHNYLLNQNAQHKVRYELIKAGQKIKYYMCKDQRSPVFAFVRGMYPKEFAPPVDIDAQFEKNVLSIINMFIETMGMPTLNKTLKFKLDLFSFS